MTTPTSPPDPANDPELEAFAARLSADKSAESKLLLPISDEGRKNLTNRVLSSSTSSNVVRPNPAIWRRKWVVATSALALAAGVLLFILTRPPQTPSLAYALEVSGDALVRSSDTPSVGPVHLHPSTRLVVRLRPEKQGPPAALRMFVVRGEKAAPVDVAYKVETGGTLVIDSPAKQALGEQSNGPASFVFVVGSNLPAETRLQELAENPTSPSTNEYTILKKEVLFEGWETAQLQLNLPNIELFGCVGLTAAGVCEVNDGTELRLWVPLEHASARFVGSGTDEGLIPKKGWMGGRSLLKKRGQMLHG